MQRVPLDLSDPPGPVPKCREEQHRLTPVSTDDVPTDDIRSAAAPGLFRPGLTMYEAQARAPLVLKMAAFLSRNLECVAIHDACVAGCASRAHEISWFFLRTSEANARDARYKALQ